MKVDLKSYTDQFNSILPTTAIIAIFLFICREILTDYRSWKSRKKVKKSVYLLISEEIEKNHWSLKKFFDALWKVREAAESPCEFQRCMYVSKRNGTSFIRREYMNGDLNSQSPIPPFQSTKYEKLIDKIAELDEVVFKLMQCMYSEIAELNHYRDTLIEYLREEVDEGFDKMTESFLSRLSEDHDKYYSSLNDLYVKLGNKELTQHRLR